MTPELQTESARSRRDQEDIAAVIAVLTAVAAQGSASEPAAKPRAFWGDPAHALGITGPGSHGWWISGHRR